ncbi:MULTISPECIES: diguanylate cyclase domain-containing protein [unclassified Planococcus (in: firmicutes)]|uniref:diguanylate cyclase domain-containing protein n=1 Tax=Planococcus TaxID=1372 RepID=UPI000C3423F7|nr:MULTISPECIES: diguanylate cyclase [unclassified Planococcus (in: firmicutes)]AUD13944.1 diguanylate cyclase [Planococcus sp. MB-3u-03]PKG47926.1 diguanylate cyclase [Planococcus sp. Urea-trap-24]PKG91774.1 diguanylate cyclase [Planococcus sp. Urea-3u-39]PKH43322.1 diguanylate cyclase [Planococcus sp. MB-3u-09]
MSGPFTKEQMDMLYEKAADPVYFMQQQGNGFIYAWVNPVCQEIFGVDLTGRTVEECMPRELALEIHKQYRIAIKRNERHLYRDYSLFSDRGTAMETELTPFKHEGVQYVLAITRDVTEQKKIEEDYLFYQSLVQNSVDPMLMISADFTILDMNPAYEKTFGVHRKEWLGRNYDDIPQDKQKFFEMGKLLLENSTSTHKASSIFLSRIKSDGREAKFSASYSLIKENGIIRAFHVVFRELTNELLLKHELKRTENILESYKDALNYAALVLIWDISGMIEFANENFKKLTGFESSELTGMNIQSIGQAIMSGQQLAHLQSVLKKGEIWRGQVRSLKKNGQPFWVDATIIPLFDVEGRIYQMLSILFDITDRKEMEEQLHHMAYHDPLTNLPNRRMMVKHFREMEAKSNRTGDQVAVLYIDGDNFKEINDLHGHEIGDEFIHQFARALERSIRKYDVAARIGGDEFLILLPGISAINSRKQIENIISRIQQTLKDGWAINGRQFSPTCSIGSALYPEDGSEFEELIQKADHALYEAKKKGGGIVCFHGEA